MLKERFCFFVLIFITGSYTLAEKCVYHKLKKITQIRPCSQAIDLIFKVGWQVDGSQTLKINKWPNSSINFINNIKGGIGDCAMYKMVYKEMEDCCRGWMGVNCDIATCSHSCIHGSCAGPDTCTCTEAWSGRSCDENIKAVNDTTRYCYIGSACKSDKVLNASVVPKDKCCSDGSDTSWGHQGKGATEGQCLSCLKEKPPAVAVTGNKRVPFRTCVSGLACSVRTFDGVTYNYCTHCTLYLLSTADIVVSMHTDLSSATPHKVVTIRSIYRQIRYTLSNDSVVMSADNHDEHLEVVKIGDIREHAIQIGELEVNIVGDSVFIAMRRYDLRVRRDNYMQVFITVGSHSSLRKDHIKGACGNYDDDVNDEVKLANNQQEAGKFGLEWTDESCPSRPRETKYNSEMKKAAEAACSVLSSKLFERCHSLIDVQPYVQSCIEAYCLTKHHNDTEVTETHCKAVGAYAGVCALEDIVIQWRTDVFCPKHCPKNMVYRQCGPSCKPTCGYPIASYLKNECDMCCSGCHCQEGLVLHNGACIQPTNCPCVHKTDAYDFGHTLYINETCQMCTCGHFGHWDCKVTPCPATCSVYGPGVLTTFDGEEFRLGTHNKTCDYTLVSVLKSKLEIKLQTRICENKTSAVHATGFQVKSGKQHFSVELTLSGQFRFLDLVTNTNADLPFLSAGFYVRQTTGSSVLADFSGFRLMFDANNYLTISTDESIHFGIVRGLCGNLNNLISDERLMPSGVEAFSDNIFVAAFSDNKCGLIISPPQQIENHPQCASLKLLYEAFNQSEGTAENVYRICMSYTDPKNICSAILKLAITADISLTSVLDYPLDDMQIMEACTDELMSCEDGLVYREDIDLCTTNCLDLVFGREKCQRKIIRGCSCADGFYRNNNGSCVPKSQCSCLNTATGKYYKPGLVHEIPCHECHCTQGQLRCEEKGCEKIFCPKDQVPVITKNASNVECLNYKCPDKYSNQITCSDNSSHTKKCVCKEGYVMTQFGTCVQFPYCPCYHEGVWHKNGTEIVDKCFLKRCNSGMWMIIKKTKCQATCFISGSETQIVTFDGTSYSFDAKSSYTLVKTQGDGQGFQISFRNLACGSNERACSHKIDIDFMGIHMELVTGAGVIVGNKTYSVDEPVQIGIFKVMSTTLYIVISFLDVTVYWSGGLLTWIKVSSRWDSKLEGLCGTYDYNTKNDFRKPDGSIDNDVWRFTESWKKEDILMTHENESSPCQNNPGKMMWSSAQCNIIKSSEAFQQCRDAMPLSHIDRYVADCEKTTCWCNGDSDSDCLCDTIAHFAAVCDSLGHPVVWRHQHLCPVQCGGDMVYSPSNRPCKTTCLDVINNSTQCDVAAGVEGCFCPPGKVWHESKCIPAAQCPCYDGMYLYDSGTVLKKDCKICVCDEGKFVCRQTNCSECLQGEFKCRTNGMCIHLSDVCNGIFDCYDGSDESSDLCNKKNCSSEQFQCRLSGECIHSSQLCDGFAHCDDASDEDKDKCKVVCDHRCHDGRCLYKDYICDGYFDCSDGSDELGCAEACEQGHFKCNNSGVCIQSNYICDGHDDCGDGADELGCTTVTASSRKFEQGTRTVSFTNVTRNPITSFTTELSGQETVAISNGKHQTTATTSNESRHLSTISGNVVTHETTIKMSSPSGINNNSNSKENLTGPAIPQKQPGPTNGNGTIKPLMTTRESSQITKASISEASPETNKETFTPRQTYSETLAGTNPETSIKYQTTPETSTTYQTSPEASTTYETPPKALSETTLETLTSEQTTSETTLTSPTIYQTTPKAASETTLETLTSEHTISETTLITPTTYQRPPKVSSETTPEILTSEQTISETTLKTPTTYQTTPKVSSETTPETLTSEQIISETTLKTPTTYQTTPKELSERTLETLTSEQTISETTLKTPTTYQTNPKELSERTLETLTSEQTISEATRKTPTTYQTTPKALSETIPETLTSEQTISETTRKTPTAYQTTPKAASETPLETLTSEQTISETTIKVPTTYQTTPKALSETTLETLTSEQTISKTTLKTPTTYQTTPKALSKTTLETLTSERTVSKTTLTTPTTYQTTPKVASGTTLETPTSSPSECVEDETTVETSISLGQTTAETLKSTQTIPTTHEAFTSSQKHLKTTLEMFTSNQPSSESLTETTLETVMSSKTQAETIFESSTLKQTPESSKETTFEIVTSRQTNFETLAETIPETSTTHWMTPELTSETTREISTQKQTSSKSVAETTLETTTSSKTNPETMFETSTLKQTTSEILAETSLATVTSEQTLSETTGKTSTAYQTTIKVSPETTLETLISNQTHSETQTEASTTQWITPEASSETTNETFTSSQTYPETILENATLKQTPTESLVETTLQTVTSELTNSQTLGETTLETSKTYQATPKALSETSTTYQTTPKELSDTTFKTFTSSQSEKTQGERIIETSTPLSKTTATTQKSLHEIPQPTIEIVTSNKTNPQITIETSKQTPEYLAQINPGTVTSGKRNSETSLEVSTSKLTSSESLHKTTLETVMSSKTQNETIFESSTLKQTPESPMETTLKKVTSRQTNSEIITETIPETSTTQCTTPEATSETTLEISPSQQTFSISLAETTVETAPSNKTHPETIFETSKQTTSESLVETRLETLTSEQTVSETTLKTPTTYQSTHKALSETTLHTFTSEQTVYETFKTPTTYQTMPKASSETTLETLTSEQTISETTLKTPTTYQTTPKASSETTLETLTSEQTISETTLKTPTTYQTTPKVLSETTLETLTSEQTISETTLKTPTTYQTTPKVLSETTLETLTSEQIITETTRKTPTTYQTTPKALSETTPETLTSEQTTSETTRKTPTIYRTTPKASSETTPETLTSEQTISETTLKTPPTYQTTPKASSETTLETLTSEQTISETTIKTPTTYQTTPKALSETTLETLTSERTVSKTTLTTPTTYQTTPKVASGTTLETPTSSQSECVEDETTVETSISLGQTTAETLKSTQAIPTTHEAFTSSQKHLKTTLEMFTSNQPSSESLTETTLEAVMSSKTIFESSTLKQTPESSMKSTPETVTSRQTNFETVSEITPETSTSHWGTPEATSETTIEISTPKHTSSKSVAETTLETASSSKTHPETIFETSTSKQATSESLIETSLATVTSEQTLSETTGKTSTAYQTTIKVSPETTLETLISNQTHSETQTEASTTQWITPEASSETTTETFTSIQTYPETILENSTLKQTPTESLVETTLQTVTSELTSSQTLAHTSLETSTTYQTNPKVLSETTHETLTSSQSEKMQSEPSNQTSTPLSQTTAATQEPVGGIPQPTIETVISNKTHPQTTLETSKQTPEYFAQTTPITVTSSKRNPETSHEVSTSTLTSSETLHETTLESVMLSETQPETIFQSSTLKQTPESSMETTFETVTSRQTHSETLAETTPETSTTHWTTPESSSETSLETFTSGQKVSETTLETTSTQTSTKSLAEMTPVTVTSELTSCETLAETPPKTSTTQLTTLERTSETTLEVTSKPTNLNSFSKRTAETLTSKQTISNTTPVTSAPKQTHSETHPEESTQHETTLEASSEIASETSTPSQTNPEASSATTTVTFTSSQTYPETTLESFTTHHTIPEASSTKHQTTPEVFSETTLGTLRSMQTTPETSGKTIKFKTTPRQINLETTGETSTSRKNNPELFNETTTGSFTSRYKIPETTIGVSTSTQPSSESSAETTFESFTSTQATSETSLELSTSRQINPKTVAETSTATTFNTDYKLSASTLLNYNTSEFEVTVQPVFQNDTQDNCSSDCLGPWSCWSACPRLCRGVRVRIRAQDTENPSCKCNEAVLSEAISCSCNHTSAPQTLPTTASGLCQCNSSKECTSCFEECEQSCRAFRSKAFCKKPAECSPGCKCPEGQLMDDDGFCTPSNYCPCYDTKGTEVPYNSTYIDPSSCKICQCSENGSVCEDRQKEFEMIYEWAPWSDWSTCASLCGNGTSSRYRSGQHYGCSTRQEESKPCSSKECHCLSQNGDIVQEGQTYRPDECHKCRCVKGDLVCKIDPNSVVNGEWEDWSRWSPCEGNCSLFSKTRSRYCKPPVCGGQICDGASTEIYICSSEPCCDVFKWSDWTLCTQTCGRRPGSRSRHKIYTDLARDKCEGYIHMESCGLCNCDYQNQTWSEWTSCANERAVCGWGKRTRHRSISDQCVKNRVESTQTEPCFMGPCNCSSHLVWSNNSLCEQKCHMDRPADCSLHISGGCVCPNSLFSTGSNCVTNKLCPNECVYSNITYQDGQHFNCDDCKTCQCVRGQIETLNRKDCPDVRKCNLSTHRLVPSRDGCCLVDCVPQETCTVHQANAKHVTINNCRSVEKVTKQFCAGPCPTVSDFLDYSTLHERHLECPACSPRSTFYKGVEFKCDNGTSLIHPLPFITECNCE